MNNSPMLAALDKAPEIYGPLPLTEPGLADSPYFLPSVAAVGIVLFCLFVLLVVRIVRRSRVRKIDPAGELQARLALLSGAAPSQALYLELAAILRGAVGLCFGMDSVRMTARELAAAIAERDSFNRAASAIDLLQRCEEAVFSGSSPEGADSFVEQGRIALGALLSNIQGSSER